MNKSIGMAAVTALLLSGCASTLKPLQIPLKQISASENGQSCVNAPAFEGTATTTPTDADVSARARLSWLTCALQSKAQANLRQAERFENRTEWRDIPLLGAAATVAGLLLFGERDAKNALKPGEQDVIAGVGFGAAAFATFANYLSPAKARTLLRQGARGHFCMATQSELILTVYDSVQKEGRRQARKELGNKLADLRDLLAKNDDTLFSDPAAAKAARDAAIKAVEAYDQQVQQLHIAPVMLSQAAWTFGIDLLTSADRSEQKVEDLIKSIKDQTESITKFGMAETKAADPAPKQALQKALPAFQLGAFAVALTAKQKNDQLAFDVAVLTPQLLDGLVNIEALVSGFDSCAATALAGGVPKPVKIQRATIQ